MNDSPKTTTISKHRIWLWLTILVALFIFISFATMSVLRYQSFLTSKFDLGNMAQAIYSVTQGRPLELTDAFGTISRMSWHVELIYYPIAALYALWPSPETLVVLQSLLFALGAWPVYRFAKRRLGTPMAGFLGSLLYLFYPVALTALLFEFHADTLGISILIFAIEAFDRRAWRSYAFWIMVALGTKIYIAAPVFVLGAVIWLLGERRAGVATALAATAWGLVALFIIQPLFAPTEISEIGPFVDGNYLTTHFNLAALLPTLGLRLVSIFVVLLPILLLGWRAWLWILPALAIMLPAAFSVDVNTYRFTSHHYALAVPFLVTAAIYGAVRFKDNPGKSKRNWTGDLMVTVLLTVLLSLAIVDTPVNPRYLQMPWQERLEIVGHHVSSRDRMRADWLAKHVPPDAPIMASALNVTHLINRLEIYPTEGTGRSVEVWGPQVEAAAIDGFFEIYLGGSIISEQVNVAYFMNSPEFKLTQQRDGMLLFAKDGDALAQELEVTSGDGEYLLEDSFGDLIGLVSVELVQLSEQRYRLTYIWTPLKSLAEFPDLFAVTRIASVENSRYLHLPTWTLLTTSDWQEGTLIRETMEIILPKDISSGEYALLVGWYHSEDILAVYSDERTRVGEEVEIGMILVP